MPTSTPNGPFEFARPLHHQVDLRRDDQRRPADLLDAQERGERLAGAGRHHDDAAAPAFIQALHGVALVVARGAVGVELPAGGSFAQPRAVSS